MIICITTKHESVMKKPTFIILFIGTNIFFIFVQVYKQSQVIKLSYQKQKNEAEKEALSQKKDDLTQQLYALKNRTSIKKYAQNKLNMRKINLKQIKKLPAHEQTIQS